MAGLRSFCNLLFAATLALQAESKYEHVVTNIDDVYAGTDVDYRYNETKNSVSAEDGLPSVPGCPKSVEGYPWVYYGSPERCYLVGEKGPCEVDQIIFVEKGSSHGFCGCECLEGMEQSDNNHEHEQFCQSGISKEFVFIPKSKKCFQIFEQGPCKTDEWIVKVEGSDRNSTRCEKRKCPEGSIFVKLDDKPEGECQMRFTGYAGPAFILPNDCEADGMKYSNLLNKCLRKFSSFLG